MRIGTNKERLNFIKSTLTKEFLTEQCKTKQLIQIAEETGISASCIGKYARKFHIVLFNPRDKGRKAWNKTDTADRGRYLMDRDNPEGTKERRYHNVIRKHIGRKVDCSKEVVHHLNRNSRDDRLENLVLMQKKDHDRLHMILRNKHLYNCTLDEALIFLFKDRYSDEIKRYAELTRIIPNTEEELDIEIINSMITNWEIVGSLVAHLD